MRTLLLLLFLPCGPAAWAQATTEAQPPLSATLATMMREGIGTDSPNSSRWYRAAGGSLFTGSYDWHSTVIAHWALLVIGRVEGDPDCVRFVLDRLGPEALEAEAALLDEVAHSRRQTYPYDQAWLLMLLSELDQHLAPGEDGVAWDLRSATEHRLLDWLEDAPFPEFAGPEFAGKGLDSPYCGFYRSWLWAYLLVRWSGPITDGATERLDALRDERIRPQRQTLLSSRGRLAYDFLWVPAVQALVERADPAFEPACDYPLQEFPALPESVKLSTVHVVGLELSRLWPYAVDAHRGIAGADSAYQARTREILARPDLWSDNFTVVSHWVPQFLWIGEWLRRGRP